MQSIRLLLLVVVAASWLVACERGAEPALDPEDHAREIESWRRERVERLTSETGWLTLVGLYWLQPGENRFGAAPDNDVRFPDGLAPAHAGALVLGEDGVRLLPAVGVSIEVGGAPPPERPLRTDEDGEPDLVTLGDLTFFVIRRGDRLGVRARHPDHPARTGFQGIDTFPIDPAFRVEGVMQPYDEPRKIAVPTVLGTEEPMWSPGVVRFELGSETLTLEPTVGRADARRLFFIFRDATSGKETYPAGRFLYAEWGEDDRVVLDFNKAYNPPCAFTPYATCPLPPRQNWLAVRIEAGEKDYGEH